MVLVIVYVFEELIRSFVTCIGLLPVFTQA